MTTKLMWMAMDLEFILIRWYPFPFPFSYNSKKLTLNYNSSWSFKYLPWHLFMKLGIPSMFVLSLGFLSKEIFKPSQPQLSTLQIFAIFCQTGITILVYDFATEFSTNGRGVIDVFNELKRIERRLLGKLTLKFKI